MAKNVILLVFLFSTVAVLVNCGMNGKWMIKAKGKGMQNLISHGGGGGGGGGGHHYEHKEYKKPEIHYYPVPVHHEHKHGYHGEGSHHHEVKIIPLYDNGKGYGSGRHSNYGYDRAYH